MAEDKTSKNDEVVESSKSTQKETDKTEEKETLETKETEETQSEVLGKMKHFRKVAEQAKEKIVELEGQIKNAKPRDESELQAEVRDIGIRQNYPDLESDDIDMAKAIASSKGIPFEKAVIEETFKNYLIGKKEMRRQEAATPSPSGRGQTAMKGDSFEEAQKTGDFTKVIAERLFPKK